MEQLLELMPWIWAGIIVVTIIIELFSSDIDALWFSIGAVVSLVLSFFKFHITIQLSAFLFVTVILLFTIGKIAKKLLLTKNISKNSDSLIGKEILILESANEFENGSGVINDIVWTVSCQAGIIVEKGKHAIIVAMDGNKLVVKNKEEIKHI